MSPQIILYHNDNTSCSIRIRLALSLKNIKYTSKELCLQSREHHSDKYKKINSLCVVPTLVHENLILSESLAIIEYLDEKYPEIKLLPEDITSKFLAREMAQIISSQIHPYQAAHFYKKEYSNDWENSHLKNSPHWILRGFKNIEEKLTKNNSVHFCIGDKISIADIALLAQCINAKYKFNIDIGLFPRISSIYNELSKKKEVINAYPKHIREIYEKNIIN